MRSIIENDKEFKEAIGAFIIAFSELEFGLAQLGTMTEFNLQKKDSYLIRHMGYSFSQKVKNLTDYITEHLAEIKPIWDDLKKEIDELNRERRFIAHGFIQYFLSGETKTTYIKEGKKLTSKKHDIKSIKVLTNRLHHLNTGKNGVCGEFHSLFSKTRVDKWNELVNDDFKIVYRMNNIVVSDWKGSK